MSVHMSASNLALARDFAQKSGGFTGIYQKCSTCLPVRPQKIESD